jgi:hypothetical protein
LRDVKLTFLTLGSIGLPLTRNLINTRHKLKGSMSLPKPRTEWNRYSFESLLALALVCCAIPVSAAVNVLTYHNDNARTGQNTNETVLTPAVVASANFGKIFNHPVDGEVYAQPLVVTQVNIPGKGTHNVVYIATQHDSVYAFDADNDAGPNAAPLWQVSFINPAAGVSTVSANDVACTDVIPENGIASTPVIDVASGTLYVVAKTKETTNGVANFYHRLHALDISTGAEKFGGPVVMQATVPGTGQGHDGTGHVTFNPLTHLNRSALLLSRGVVYIASASHCDVPPYHGWVMGYDAHTLAFSNVFNTTPNGEYGGIWMSGSGPVADTNGNIYVVTGNGTFDATTGVNSFGDSYLKFSTTNGLALADYFTPYNQDNLYNRDLDLGSGGTILLPDEAGSGANQHLLVGASKEGTIYLLNRDNMGHYNSGSDSQIVQSLPHILGSSFDTPAYFNHRLFYVGVHQALKSFPIANAHIDTNNIGLGPETIGYPGATPSISANGTNNAIVWVLQNSAYDSGSSVLHAYDATNVANELYDSLAAEDGVRDDPGVALKFNVPTVANGKVYVGAGYMVSVYGVGNFLPTPVISPAGAVFTNSIQITLSDSTSGTSIFYTLDGSTPTTNSIPYNGPFTMTNSAGLRVRAFKSNFVHSGVAFATFLNSKSIGTGTGLNAAYYSGQLRTFTNPPTLTRTDPTIDFEWGGGAPDPSIDPNNFTTMWTGTVQPQFSENYTFYANTDDGVRLWVNGQLLVDEWVDQSYIEWSGSIPLQAGSLYPIAMQYYQNAGDSWAHLAWSSPSLGKGAIPQSQLYPRSPARLSLFGAPAGDGLKIRVDGLPGKDYILQASSNLKTWTALQTNFAVPDPSAVVPTNLTFFVDLTATNFPSRFYRVLQRP